MTYKTKDELSKELRVTRETIDNWVKQGKLKRVKIGGRVLFEQSEIDRLISENRI
jgi:DNA binding domain, excisionase family